MEILRKYGASATIYFPLVTAGDSSFDTTPVTHASGDTQISKDGGAFGNTTNAFTHEGNGIYSLILTATEMEAANIVVTVVDSATKAWEDQSFIIQTYGNASAGMAFDLDTATQSVNVTTIEGTDATDQINAACDTALADYDAPTKAELDSGFAALNDLDAAGIRSAVGLAAANLDTQLSTIDTVVDAIQVDTQDLQTQIGTDGAGLTAIPWNAAWDAEVQSEVTDGLNAYDAPTKAEMDAAFTEIKGATWSSVTDTLEAIRDRGDAAWTTATGFLDAAGVRSAVGLASANLDTQLGGIQTTANAIETDTQDLQTQIGVDGAGLTALPWNAAWDAEVQSEVTDALNAYDPPTKAELDAGFAGLNDLSAAEVNAEVDTALADIHLDHLFANTYDSATPPGAADSFLNELTENDGGLVRFTANALEQAPAGGGGGATAQQIWEYDISAISTAGQAGKIVNDILADTATLATIDGKIDTIDTNVDAVLVDTGTTLPASIATIDTNVDAILVDTGTTLPASISALPTAAENAEELLKTDMSTITGEASRSPLNALRHIRNRWAVSGGTLTVYKEDDTTSAWTSTISSNASADPITGSDPA